MMADPGPSSSFPSASHIARPTLITGNPLRNRNCRDALEALPVLMAVDTSGRERAVGGDRQGMGVKINGNGIGPLGDQRRRAEGTDIDDQGKQSQIPSQTGLPSSSSAPTAQTPTSPSSHPDLTLSNNPNPNPPLLDTDNHENKDVRISYLKIPSKYKIRSLPDKLIDYELPDFGTPGPPDPSYVHPIPPHLPACITINQDLPRIRKVEAAAAYGKKAEGRMNYAVKQVEWEERLRELVIPPNRKEWGAQRRLQAGLQNEKDDEGEKGIEEEVESSSLKRQTEHEQGEAVALDDNRKRPCLTPITTPARVESADKRTQQPKRAVSFSLPTPVSQEIPSGSGVPSREPPKPRSSSYVPRSAIAVKSPLITPTSPPRDASPNTVVVPVQRDTPYSPDFSSVLSDPIVTPDLDLGVSAPAGQAVSASPTRTTGIFSVEGESMVFIVMQRDPSSNPTDLVNLDKQELEEIILAHGGRIAPQISLATHLIFLLPPSETLTRRLDQSAYKLFVKRVAPDAVLSYEWIKHSVEMKEMVPMEDYTIALPTPKFLFRPGGSDITSSRNGSIRQPSTASFMSESSFSELQPAMRGIPVASVKREDEDDDVVCLSPPIIRDTPTIRAPPTPHVSTSATQTSSTAVPPATATSLVPTTAIPESTTLDTSTLTESSVPHSRPSIPTSPAAATRTETLQADISNEPEAPVYEVKTIRNSLVPVRLVPLGKNKRPKSPSPPPYRPSKRVDIESSPPIPLRQLREAQESSHRADINAARVPSNALPTAIEGRSSGPGRNSIGGSEDLLEMVIATPDRADKHHETSMMNRRRRANTIDSLFSGYSSDTTHYGASFKPSGSKNASAESDIADGPQRSVPPVTQQLGIRRIGINRKILDIRRKLSDGRQLLSSREHYDICEPDHEHYELFKEYLADCIEADRYSSVTQACQNWDQKHIRRWETFWRKYRTRLADDLPCLEKWTPHPNPRPVNDVSGLARSAQLDQVDSRYPSRNKRAAHKVDDEASDDTYSGSSTDTATSAWGSTAEDDTPQLTPQRSSVRIAHVRPSQGPGTQSKSASDAVKSTKNGHQGKRPWPKKRSHRLLRDGWYARRRYAPDGRKLLIPRERWDILAEDREAVDALKSYIQENASEWTNFWKNLGYFAQHHNNIAWKGKSLFEKYRTRLFDDIPVLETLLPHPNPKSAPGEPALNAVSEGGEDVINPQVGQLKSRQTVYSTEGGSSVAGDPVRQQWGVMRGAPSFYEMLQADEGSAREVSVTSEESDGGSLGYGERRVEKKSVGQARSYRCAPDGRRLASSNEHWDVIPADQADLDMLVNHIQTNAGHWSSLLSNIGALNETNSHRCFKSLYYKYKTRLYHELPILLKFQPHPNPKSGGE